jgi:16S rRNA (guanine527-N7)-methyltransferase
VGHALNGTAELEIAFAAADIAPLPNTALEQFCAYLELLQRWNQRLNLTAIREPAEIIQRHFVECVFAAQHLPRDIVSLLDFGSGGGFPGIPIAICRREIQVALAEAQGKKASFLREAFRVIGISGEVYDGRVERMPKERQFDAVSMRAVEKMERAIPVAAERTRRYLILFTTEQLTAKHRQLTPGLTWLEDIRLPDADQRVLAIGQRI